MLANTSTQKVRKLIDKRLNKQNIMDEHYVYLIGCRSRAESYVKIGMTSSIRRRLSNIQTGCPHAITEAFVILSECREEIEGLERLLHTLLEHKRLRAEWYEGTDDFYLALDRVLSRVNAGDFSYEEIEAVPDFYCPELEIMMHGHDFKFRRVRLPLRKGEDVLSGSELTGPSQISELLQGKPPNKLFLHCSVE